MAEKYLGPSFEIHGGGLDLVFPHHEDEIAQSQGAGREFARMWMHNGMLEFSGDEMHKSTGNIVTLRDALDRWGRETLLLFFMTGHWRKPLDYSDATLTAAAARAEGFREVFRNPSEPAPATLGSASPPRSTTISTPPRRSRSCTSGETTTCFGARSGSSGSSRWRSWSGRRPRSSTWPSGASARGRSVTSARPTGCAPR